jgi:hypothetical protein
MSVDPYILKVMSISLKSSVADPDPNLDPPDQNVLSLLDADPNPLVRGMDPAPDPDPSIIKQK